MVPQALPDGKPPGYAHGEQLAHWTREGVELLSHQLSICVPAYNEEEGIAKSLAMLRKEFPEAELIVVDDGSDDRTGEIARAIEGVRLISHERNRGYGASLKVAMREARGEVIAWFDADGQHDARDLRTVVEPVLSGEKDSVIGVRSGSSGDRFPHRSGKWILKRAAELIVRHRVPDLNSGIRCFKGKVIRRYLHLLPDGFSASSTTTLLMMKRGYRLGYQEIPSRPREGNQSSVRPIRDGWRTLQVLVRMLMLFEAFGFFTVLSALQIVPAVIYGVWIALANREGFPILAATVIISGLLTFFMGLLGDQITELRKEKFED